MGYYINPPDETKEKFLQREGTLIPAPPATFDFHPDQYIVCLVDNGLFTAAGIAYSQRELDAFTTPGNRRPKLWYRVPKEALAPYV